MNCASVSRCTKAGWTPSCRASPLRGRPWTLGVPSSGGGCLRSCYSFAWVLVRAGPGAEPGWVRLQGWPVHSLALTPTEGMGFRGCCSVPSHCSVRSHGSVPVSPVCPHLSDLSRLSDLSHLSGLSPSHRMSQGHMGTDHSHIKVVSRYLMRATPFSTPATPHPLLDTPGFLQECKESLGGINRERGPF